MPLDGELVRLRQFTVFGYNRADGVKAQSTEARYTAREQDGARETADVVALLRQLREKMGLVEELEPDSRMLREYRHMRGWVIIELRRIRASVELALRRQGITARERKIAAEHLHLVALVESEVEAESGGSTSH